MTTTNGEVTPCSPQSPTQNFSSPYSPVPTHKYSTITLLSLKTRLQKAVWGLLTSLSEFIHAKKRFLSLETLTLPCSLSHIAGIHHECSLALISSGIAHCRCSTPTHGPGQLVQGSWSMGHCVAAWKYMPHSSHHQLPDGDPSSSQDPKWRWRV